MIDLPLNRTSSLRLMMFVAAALAAPLSGCVNESTPVAPPGRQAAAISPEQAAQIEAGRAVAERNCASCHAIGAEGDSPDKRAPIFRTVLGRYDADTLATELIVGVRVAHTPMPQFEFKPSSADALIAYLRSMQTPEPGRRLAEQGCSRCHAVGDASASPHPAARPFRTLGQRWRRGELRGALKGGAIAGHDKLNDAEIDALQTFLDSVATAENPAPRLP